MKILCMEEALDYFEEWLHLRKLSTETIRGYLMDVRQFYQWRSLRWNAPLNVCELESEHMEGFLHYLSKERKCLPQSVNRKINGLSTFFECLRLKEWIDRNPMDYVPRMKVIQKERQYLTAEEIEKIVYSISSTIVRTLLLTMAYTGMRISECTKLRLHHLDFKERSVLIENAKGGKTRRIPLNPEICTLLTHYLKETRPVVQTDLVFATKRTEQVSPQYVNACLRKAVKQSGVTKHVTSHVFRHSFASHLIKKGVHIAVIQKLLGHANLKTTSTYLHVDNEELVNAIDRVAYDGVANA